MQTTISIFFTAAVQPVPIIARDFQGEEMYLAGWGREESTGPLSVTLKYITTFAIGYDRCQEQIDINPDNVCAFNSIGSGLCTGDSGSGLLIEGEGIAGMASFIVESCGGGRPDGLVNLPFHRVWILENTI